MDAAARITENRQRFGKNIRRTPGDPEEGVGQERSFPEPDQIVATVAGRAQDNITILQGSQGFVDDPAREIGAVAADDHRGVEAPGKGRLEGMVHPPPKIFALLRDEGIPVSQPGDDHRSRGRRGEEDQ